MLKIVVNDDKERVGEIREALKETHGYCPCALLKNDDTKCMCKEFRESRFEGTCHCGLYKKVEI